MPRSARNARAKRYASPCFSIAYPMSTVPRIQKKIGWPYSRIVSAMFIAPAAGQVRIEIVDSSGRAIRTESVSAQAGLNRWQWNLQGDAPALTAEQQAILERRGILTQAEIHQLAHKTREKMSGAGDKAACHSDLADRKTAEQLQSIAEE